MKNWRSTGWCALLATVLSIPAMAQDEGNVPPTIQIVGLSVEEIVSFRGGSGQFGASEVVPIGILPGGRLFTEGARITVTLRIVDADWTVIEDDQDATGEQEEVFIRFLARQLPDFGVVNPVSPPIPQASVLFVGASTESGFRPPPGETTLDLPFTFTIPEFNGRNQARLLNLVPYDVWFELFFQVSNDQEGGAEGGFGESVGVDVLDIFCIENSVIPSPNARPFADAGPDQTVVVGSVVKLDGSRTFDSYNVGFDIGNDLIIDKDDIEYAWEWVSGPERVDPVQGSINSPTATVTLNTAGNYVYRLTVDDNVNSLPTQDNVVVSVLTSLPTNRAPRAVIVGPSGSVPAGTLVTLDGSQSSDPDGNALSYLWRQIDQLGGALPAADLTDNFQGLSGVTSSKATFQANVPGTYYFRLVVTDSRGLFSSAQFSIQVVASQTQGANISQQTASGTDEGSEVDLSDVTPSGAMCGAGTAALMMVPLLLWPMRGRIR